MLVIFIYPFRLLWHAPGGRLGCSKLIVSGVEAGARHVCLLLSLRDVQSVSLEHSRILRRLPIAVASPALDATRALADFTPECTKVEVNGWSRWTLGVNCQMS